METPTIDFANLSDEQISFIRKNLPKKKKYEKKQSYRMKENKVRFFNPDEWEKFIYSTSDTWRFTFWFFLLTGVRYKEAKVIQIMDFDFPNRNLFIKKPKGIDAGKVQRTVNLSPYAVKFIRSYIHINNLKNTDTFKFQTIQGVRQYMQRQLKAIGINDWRDFSVHNLRKTHENFMMSLDVPEGKLFRHMGHTMKTANQHYLSSAFIKDVKQLNKIRIWLDGAF